MQKFYRTKRQHYTPSIKWRKNKVPVHVYRRVHNNVRETYVYMRAQCFFLHQRYLLIHARILRTQKHYTPCKERPKGQGVPPGLFIPTKSGLDPFLISVENARQIWCPNVQPFLRKIRTERYQVYPINIIDFKDCITFYRITSHIKS